MAGLIYVGVVYKRVSNGAFPHAVPYHLTRSTEQNHHSVLIARVITTPTRRVSLWSGRKAYKITVTRVTERVVNDNSTTLYDSDCSDLVAPVSWLVDACRLCFYVYLFV